MTALAADLAEGSQGCDTSNGTSKLGGRRIEVILVDLDDTLYQVEAAPQMVRERIGGKISFKLLTTAVAASHLCIVNLCLLNHCVCSILLPNIIAICTN
jgi:hypothetical protein